MENEQQEKIDPAYIKQFNNGYQMAKHMPELADQLKNAIGTNDPTNGFLDGQKQYLDEMSREKRPSWLKTNLEDRFKPNEPDLEKDSRDKLPDLEP